MVALKLPGAHWIVLLAWTILDNVKAIGRTLYLDPGNL